MRKTLIALLLAGALPTLALAMPEGGPRDNQHCGQDGMRGEHRGPGMRMFKDLDLSAEQRAQMGELMRERKNGPQEITQKYLDKLSETDKQALHKELENARLEHDKAIRAILTPEQQKTFDAHKAEMDKRRAEREEFAAWKAEKDSEAE
ncbi:Spy/CpxP family protein refolding chaperone [Pseudomonas sp. J452]|uniref:Spy/CpxP family protein refolding chaperone n=1 Tax=Pseudomonas sp. J452 TaxID=2898441 RepID=UPI0021AD9264|nr:Spy/CpxP family protein refolding chaperone [Pseudomonas sp. J452]UUY08106.1 Spy/CpxP family protein refolding chaperone [Pseudomonas sp. J452]